jgi:DNA-binding NarL/FixJ family response regulator
MTATGSLAIPAPHPREETGSESDPRTGQESAPAAMMVDVPLLPGSSSATRSLVGRAAELSALAAGLGLREAPGVEVERAVVLAGDAGVGKTRLLTELRDLAFSEGWQVVAGHCLDFGDSALPFLPFSEIIGRLVTDSPRLVDEVAERHPALGRLRPGRRLLSDQQPTDATAALDSAVDRGALYDAVHALLEAAGAEQPLLLVVEDTHWADRSTRDLLSFLFSRPFTSRVAIVASYRSDDLHRRHPLRRTVSEWARIPGVGRIQLGPLPSEDVRVLVHQLHPAPLTEAEVSGIVRRADGNAFFVEELVGASALPGSLPDDLAELLLVRLDQLGEEAQLVVRCAAVAGRRISHDLLAAAAGLDSATLDIGLRDAIGHNVLVPSRGDSYAFRHALLAEAVYDDLLPGERVRLHAAFATALGEGRALGTAAELARHARVAHDLVTALNASVRAGDEAASVGGPEEAARHYETALELLADPAFPAEVAVDIASLGSRAVDALVVSGNPPRALALARRLVEELPHDAPPVWRGQLLAAVASTVMVTETTLDSLDFTTEALALVPDEPSGLRARVLHLHARALSHADRLEPAREAAVEALSMAETLDLPRLGSDVMATLAALDRDAGTTSADDVEMALENVAAVAAAAGATTAEMRALWLLGRWRYDRAEFVAAGSAFGRAVTRAEEIGRPWAPYGFDSRFSGLQVAYMLGEWDTVEALADVSGQSPSSIPEAVLAAGLLTVEAARGETGRLAVVPTLRRLWDKDGIIPITAGPATIELHALAGDRAAALAEHDEVVTTIAKLWREFFHGRVRLAAVTIAALTHGIADEGSDQRARIATDVARVLEGGETSLQILREVGTQWGPEGAAWASRLTAEHLRFRWLAAIDAPGEDELVGAWREDLANFEAMGHVYETARSQSRLAVVLQAAGEAGDARTCADLARATARRLRATPLLDDLRGIGTPVGRARAGSHDEQLTPREREILTLVATGRSNGEIGKQLFISTKTVSVHVSNILAKLGAAGRTEAAAIGRRTGLLG